MLDELERLLDAATRGPFTSPDGRNIFAGRECVATRGADSLDSATDERTRATMMALAAAYNAAPALIALARAVEWFDLARAAWLDCPAECEAEAQFLDDATDDLLAALDAMKEVQV